MRNRFTTLLLFSFLLFPFELHSNCKTALKKAARQLLAEMDGFRAAYSHIPSVYNLHLSERSPQKLKRSTKPSPGRTSPLLEEARQLQVYDDFKLLSDAIPKRLNAKQKKQLETKAKGRAEAVVKLQQHLPSEERQKNARKEYLRTMIEGTFSFRDELLQTKNLVQPEWKLESSNAKWAKAFRYTEEMWNKLLRESPQQSKGSLLVTPYPVLIAAPGRFKESYYWDTYFGMKGLLATGRVEIAALQVENFLEAIRTYGHVPNGMRDYYLSRSQPPFISSMVREVYEAKMKNAGPEEKMRLRKWLEERAYPLLKAEYENFWMDPATRFNEETGLNHHWDSENTPRPERHAFDKEEILGKTYRDVRAAAESGMDFTGAHQGEATQIAGVLLNSLLFKTEQDLAWMAEELGLSTEKTDFQSAATKRQQAMDNHLWNSKTGTYEPYNLRTQKKVSVVNAETFVPLFVGASSQKQADAVKNQLSILESNGGMMSSNLLDSPHQWDGTNGWAPFQVMTIQGLQRYGFKDDAQRVAMKWVNAVAKVYEDTGAIYERLDVKTLAPPQIDTKKYPVQEGFLWTNGSYVWALTEILGQKLAPEANEGKRK